MLMAIACFIFDLLPLNPHILTLCLQQYSLFLYYFCLVLICFHLLRTHAKEMDNKSFWKVYYEHLEMVAGLAGEFSLSC